MTVVKNLVKEPTCFKNHINPSCIDLILTNRSRSFQNTSVIENGISDFHKMTVTIMRSHYPKSTPNIVHYRNYSKFNNDYFRNDLKASLEKLENLDYQSFEIFGSTLNKYAPVKQKYIRANNSPFMTKTLCQNISPCSRLHNKFLSNQTLENMCSIIKNGKT